MNTPAVFSVASKCFVDLGEQDYEELVSPEVWNAFLAEIAHAESGVLAERLAARELAALENPPSFEEHGRFCRCHFTGGLPESAMPVESLYGVKAAPQIRASAACIARNRRFTWKASLTDWA